MSSSSDVAVPSSVLRGVTTATTPVLADLDALRGAAARAVDPSIVEAAQAEGRAVGEAEGYAAGYAAGRAAALADAEDQRLALAEAGATALAALVSAAADLAARRARSLDELGQALVAGAFELATALVGRELELTTAPGRDALARALDLATGRGPVQARLHPADLATLGDHRELAPSRDVTLVADPDVERGGCILEVDQGEIDAQLGPALERVRQVLAP